MKKFIKEIGYTFYSSNFYKDIRGEKWDTTIGFLAKAVIFLSACATILGFVVLLVFSPAIKKNASNFVNQNFPADLTITVKDNKMTTGNNQSFFIKIGDSKEGERINNKENFISILPDEKADPSVLTKYNTALAVTSDGIVAEKSEQEIRIIKYSNFNLYLDKTIVLKKVNLFSILLVPFAIFGIIPIAMILFVVAGIHLVWLFAVALLLWLFLKLKKIEIGYWESYRIGAYAIIPLIALEILVFRFGLSGRWFTTAIILAVTLIVTHKWAPRENP